MLPSMNTSHTTTVDTNTQEERGDQFQWRDSNLQSFQHCLVCGPGNCTCTLLLTTSQLHLTIHMHVRHMYMCTSFPGSCVTVFFLVWTLQYVRTGAMGKEEPLLCLPPPPSPHTYIHNNNYNNCYGAVISAESCSPDSSEVHWLGFLSDG